MFIIGFHLPLQNRDRKLRGMMIGYLPSFHLNRVDEYIKLLLVIGQEACLVLREVAKTSLAQDVQNSQLLKP